MRTQNADRLGFGLIALLLLLMSSMSMIRWAFAIYFMSCSGRKLFFRQGAGLIVVDQALRLSVAVDGWCIPEAAVYIIVVSLDAHISSSRDGSA